MTIRDLEHFRDLLLEKEQTVAGWLEAPAAAGQADIQKTWALLDQIRDALRRVDRHEYGKCSGCGDDMEPHRLEIQPVAQVCLGCISTEERRQLEDDLFLASKIHRALLPHAITGIPGFTLGVRSAAARFVGGDYYDFLPGADGSARVIVADCMGHGVAAGLLMSNIQGAIRILADGIDSPAELLKRLNRWLCRNVPVTKFVSLACVAVRPQADGTALVVHANAGHCPPLIVHRDGSTEALAPTGAVLGVQEDFDYGEQTHVLGAGDLLVLYTDGVPEAEDDAGRMFGEERLCEIVRENRHSGAQNLVDTLVSEVQSFSRRSELADDYTVVVLRKD